MDASGSSLPPFQVYCPGCETSFAAGTPRCIHCGGRVTRASATRPAQTLAPEAHPFEDELLGDKILGDAGQGDEVLTQPEPVDEQPAKRRGFFSPMILLWIFLGIMGAISRACGGAAP